MGSGPLMRAYVISAPHVPCSFSVLGMRTSQRSSDSYRALALDRGPWLHRLLFILRQYKTPIGIESRLCTCAFDNLYAIWLAIV